MFHITAHDYRVHTRQQLVELLEQFDQDDEVWRGDAGDYMIGDWTDIDEDQIEVYALDGTVGTWIASLQEQIAAV